MAHSTPRQVQAVPPLPDDQAPEPDSPQQGLLPGLLAAVRNYRRVPPERALFRELLFTTVGRTVETYVVGGFKVSAATIKLVAWGLFSRMNSAGVLIDDDGRPFSRETYARDASIGNRAVQAAIGFLKQARLIAVDPARGRQREIIRINLGGLDWSAVRRRVKILIGDRVGPEASRVNLQEPLPLYRKGDSESPLRRRRGDSESPLEMYVRTGEQISELTAVADPIARVRTDQEQQQQQHRRVEGLFGAIAARARQVGRPYDEADERKRLAAGEIDIEDLQRQANSLNAEVREQTLRRAHGPRYREHFE